MLLRIPDTSKVFDTDNTDMVKNREKLEMVCANKIHTVYITKMITKGKKNGREVKKICCMCSRYTQTILVLKKNSTTVSLFECFVFLLYDDDK